MRLYEHLSAGGANPADAGNALRELEIPNHMDLLDTLVRELVQNSLDAKAPESDKVQVKFDWAPASSEMRQGWRQALGLHENEKNPLGNWLLNKLGDNWHYLRVSDSGTIGLTGTVGQDNSDSPENDRFQRIVFRYGASAQVGASGGSWGLGGKTIVFRLDFEIGLVAYYSRPADDSEPRLIICHCLNHRENQTDFARSCSNGFAWWGESDISGQHGIRVQGVTGCRATQIASQLGFNTETSWKGTQLLVPIRDEVLDDLLANRKMKQELPKHYRLARAISESARRWYWPRLTGKVVKLQDASFEDQLTLSDLEIISRNWHPRKNMFVARDEDEIKNSNLYSTLSQLYMKSFDLQDEAVSIIQRKIHGSNNQFGVVAQLLSHNNEKLYEEFQNEAPNLKCSPDCTSWLIAHMRNTGMVISYHPMPSMDTRATSERFAFNKKEESAIVPLAIARVFGHHKVVYGKDDHQEDLTCDLESIFRSSENSSHHLWRRNLLTNLRPKIKTDWRPTFISQFYRSVQNILHPSLIEESPHHSSSQLNSLSAISSGLAASFMPEGFGEAPGRPPLPPRPRPPRPKTIRPKLQTEIKKIETQSDNKIISMAIEVVDNQTTASEYTIIFQIQVEDALLNKDKWTQNSNELYPLFILDTGSTKLLNTGSTELTITPNIKHSITLIVQGDWMFNISIKH